MELGDQANAHTAIQKAIEIELNLAKQNMLRSDTANILFNFEKPNNNVGRIFQCQICRDRYHEALFCFNASCVYCAEKTTAKDKLALICKFCSAKGHFVDNCKLNYMRGNLCQYCQ